MEGAAALERKHAAAERQDAMKMRSRFRGVYKLKGAKAKPWVAKVTEDGNCRNRPWLLEPVPMHRRGAAGV